MKLKNGNDLGSHKGDFIIHRNELQSILIENQYLYIYIFSNNVNTRIVEKIETMLNKKMWYINITEIWNSK